ncbi:hypothetical protein DSUL_100194 [Desulfovibrionales bacterium]
MSVPNNSATALIKNSNCGKCIFLYYLNLINDLITTTSISGHLTLKTDLN